MSIFLFSIEGQHPAHHYEITIEFVTKVVAKLRGASKRLLEQDKVLGHMLMVEFGTHHHNIDSSVKLCKLVCEFFAPLLEAAKVDLPQKLLQIQYEKILTKRLLAYNNDLKKKARIFVSYFESI
jgi:hypothetical protein